MQLWNFMFTPTPGNKRENSKTRCVYIHMSMQCVHMHVHVCKQQTVYMEQYLISICV